MASTPALPAPGGNASAALALANPTQPEEVVIHSGAATTEGDMSYLDEEFDPYRSDPRRDMPGVLDASFDVTQLNTINFNHVDNRTAQVAVVQQGVDPNVASQLMAAQQQALQSEANALHSEVMERQRNALVSEARDQLASIEQQAADEISRKNLLLNEQAAQAMSEQKSAQLQVTAQDHRIRELSAELTHVVNNAGVLTSSAEKSNADLQAARSELAEYRTQIDAMNQHALNMHKLAESQKKDFEAEIEKLRKEQKELIRNLKSQPLEGTPGLMIHYGSGKPIPQSSKPKGPIIEELASGSKKLSIHQMLTMSIFWQNLQSHRDCPAVDLQEMTMMMTTITTREVARTRKIRRRTERLVAADRDDDVGEILHLHLHHQHPLRRQIRILRVPLHERSKGP